MHTRRLLHASGRLFALAGLVACETEGARAHSSVAVGQSTPRAVAPADTGEPRGAGSLPPVVAEPTPPSIGAGSPDASSVAPPLSPLAARASSIVLRVPGFGDAVAVLPVGATRPRPIVVALHGIGDRPEWQCAAWGQLLGRRAFVVCPRGTPGPQASAADPRLAFEGAEALRFETAAAVDALREAYPRHADPGPVLYTGFSQGAAYGVACMVHDPATYPSAVLTEGGHDGWTSEAAAAFASRGGRRVLFLCGTGSCATAAARAEPNLRAAGVEARVHHVQWLGHVYGEAMFGPASADIAWVLAADPRFDD